MPKKTSKHSKELSRLKGEVAALKKSAGKLRTYVKVPRPKSILSKSIQRVKGNERIRLTHELGVVELNNDAVDWREFRIAALFALYERWHVHSLRLEYIPRVATTAAGTIHMAPEYDSTDILPYGDSIVPSLAATMGYNSGPVSEKCSVSMINRPMPDGMTRIPTLFTDFSVDERLSTAGKFMAYVSGLPTSVVPYGGQVGELILHYDITFMIPQPDTNGLVAREPGVGMMKIENPSQIAPGAKILFNTTRAHSACASWYQEDQTTLVPLQVDRIHTFRFREDASFDFTYLGQPLNEGQRLFHRPASYAGSDAAALTTSHHVGTVALDKGFQKIVNVISRVTDEFLEAAIVGFASLAVA